MTKVNRSNQTIAESGAIVVLEAKPIPVKERVARRVRILRSWVEEGVPQAHVAAIPKSLRAVARWHDPALGITPIPSPNDFIKHHREWGWEVREIEEMLRALHARYRRGTSPAKSTSKLVSRSAQEDIDHAWATVIGQWHTERDVSVRSVSEADELRRSCQALRDELVEAKREIAALRAELSKGRGLRVAK